MNDVTDIQNNKFSDNIPYIYISLLFDKNKFLVSYTKHDYREPCLSVRPTIRSYVLSHFLNKIFLFIRTIQS